MIIMFGYIHVAQHAYRVITYTVTCLLIIGRLPNCNKRHIIMYYDNVYNTICLGYIMQLTVKV